MKKMLFLLTLICCLNSTQLVAACETECKAYCDKECPADYWVCMGQKYERGAPGVSYQVDDPRNVKPERYEKEPQCPQGYKAKKKSCKDDCYRTCNYQCKNPCSEGCAYNEASKSCVGACRNRNVGTPPAHFNPDSSEFPKHLIQRYKEKK